MLLAALSFALMSAMVKLAGDLPAFEKVFFRSSISATILFFWVRKQRLPYFGKRKHQPYLFARAFLGTSAMFLYFYGVNYTLLADASMLSRLNPFFVTLFGWLFLKEKLTKIQIPALVLVFGAALLIIKPEFALDILPALAIVLASGISAGAHTTLRVMRGMEAPATIIFYFAFFSTLLVLPFTIAYWQMPQGVQWLYLVAMGFCAVSGQFGLTYAYRYAKASEVAIYNYATIVFAAVLGFVIWGEISDWLSIIGGIVIVASSIFVFFYNHRKEKIRLRKEKMQEKYRKAS